MTVFKCHFIVCFRCTIIALKVVNIFVKHFELPCVKKCYINKLALPYKSETISSSIFDFLPHFGALYAHCGLYLFPK